MLEIELFLISQQLHALTEEYLSSYCVSSAKKDMSIASVSILWIIEE